MEHTLKLKALVGDLPLLLKNRIKMWAKYISKNSFKKS
jgi:hypothetical protein